MARFPHFIGRSLPWGFVAGLGFGVLWFSTGRRPAETTNGSVGGAIQPRLPPAEPARRTPGHDTKTRWNELRTQAPAIARDAELADTLEALAEADPDTATELLLSLNETDRRRVVAAVLIDAARQPGEAARLAADFCRADPTGAIEHGYALVATLVRAGEFDVALQFVRIRDAVAGESENPNKWLAAAFGGWAERQPLSAARAAVALTAEGLRGEALQAVTSTWARTDPAGAAGFVTQLPAGFERALALDLTLRRWVEKSPDAAAAWIAGLAPGSEFDHAAATVATAPHLVMPHPDVAISWAERIGDGELRSHTLAAVARTWAAQDFSAAVRYVRSSPTLQAIDRAGLLAEFAAEPGP